MVAVRGNARHVPHKARCGKYHGGQPATTMRIERHWVDSFTCLMSRFRDSSRRTQVPTFTTLINFNGTNGAYPWAGLTADAAGNLFGTTLSQGPNGDGTVFEIPYSNGSYASTPTTLVSFNGTDGSAPSTGLLADAGGDLFGTTWSGGANGNGTVFEVPYADGSYASTPTVLAAVDGANESFVMGGLIADNAGDLFDTSALGGAYGYGNVFEIAYSNGGYATTPVTVTSFNNGDGASPYAGLVEDAAGNLFGTTYEGGQNGLSGVVFELPYVNGSYAGTPTTLVDFNRADGSGPVAPLTIDPAGDLFGTTEFGGANDDGTIFEIPYSNGSYPSTPTILINFDSTDGANPTASVIEDASGDLFGTTYSGGANGDGTVFEIPYSDGSYASTPTILVNFDGANGSQPRAGLLADAAGDLFGTTYSGGANGDGTAFEIIMCFLAGTQIATPTGEWPVERLQPGDLVMTLRGEARRVIWIGEGRVPATRGRRNAATPVVVRKSALADNVPHHDLRVTKAHSLYIDDVLIPVEFLINHRSILWDDQAQDVRLYHIELDSHDVLLANGAPAESYRDDGNRWSFQNANSGWSLPPQEPCAPVRTGGPVVDAVWRRLLERAGPRPGVPLTDDPGLHLRADGQRLDALERVGETYVFHLPAVPAVLHIVSRATAPAELGLARDPRVLGVALRRIVVRKGAQFRVTEADDDGLTDGYHAFETDNRFRWTDGDAAIPEELFAGLDGALELLLSIGATTRYLADDPVGRAG
jgi:uncharacterized repeat protein (TIGR03803 family)